MSARAVGYYWVLFDTKKEVSYWNGDEWVLCGIDIKNNYFTDEDMKSIGSRVLASTEDISENKDNIIKGGSNELLYKKRQ